MWNFLASVLVYASLWAINKYLIPGPDPDKAPARKRKSPSTEVGAPVPLIYGRVRVRVPVLAWYGNQYTADTTSVGGAIGPDGAGTLTYGLDMLMAVGIPHEQLYLVAVPPKFHQLFIEDTRTMGSTTLLPGQSASTLLGGISLGHRETVLVSQVDRQVVPDDLYFRPGFGRGLLGTLQFFDGRLDQDITTTLISDALSRAGIATSPGYRGYMLAALTGGDGLINNTLGTFRKHGFGLGRNPDRLPKLSFEVSTFNSPIINGTDACPVGVIFDLLTGTRGKLSLPLSSINLTSFYAATITLFNEKHGYSRVIDERVDARKLIQEILDQIDGYLYQDPATNQYTIKLVRQDYTVAALPLLDESNIAKGGVEGYTVNGWRETYNEVNVTYNDRALGYVNNIVTEQNHANAVGQGNRVRPVNVEYKGVCVRALAKTLAARDLRIYSQPLAKVRITVNRDGADFSPGDVFRWRWSDYGVVDMVLRVQRADRGQLFENKVVLDCVQDVFGSLLPVADDPTYVVSFPFNDPIRNRVLTEAPWWLQNKRVTDGLATDALNQRVLALAAVDTNSAQVFEETQNAYDASLAMVPFTTDVPLADYPISFLVETDYSGVLEPYDTATGLRVNTVTGGTMPTTTNAVADIRDFGDGLLYVNGEVLAWESITNLGGGIYRFNNVWRALLDTAPKTHVVGTRGYFLTAAAVGLRRWGATTRTRILNARAVPQGVFTGSGDDVITSLTVTNRAEKVLRVANFGITGYALESDGGTGGVVGIPSTGAFKSLTFPNNQVGTARGFFNEGFDPAGLLRQRNLTAITRGDATSEATTTTVDPGFNVELDAQPVGGTEVLVADGVGGALGFGYLLGAAGHGLMDIILYSKNVLPAGLHGVPAAQSVRAWDAPRVRVNAPRWRNLLANARFDYGDLSPGWIQGTAGITTQVSSGTNSLTRDVNGKWVGTTAALNKPAAFQSNDINISGYLPRKLRANASFYYRNISVMPDTDDTITITMTARDAAGTALATIASSALAGSMVMWQQANVNIAALPANTASIRILGNLAQVGIDTEPSTTCTEVNLRVGQFTDNLVVNGGFATGSTASWTNTVNSFAIGTAVPYEEASYAQGGAFASSEIRQVLTLAAAADGYQYGTAVLDCARANVLATDTGTVILEALDASAALLDSRTTGAEAFATLNVWQRRKLVLDLPDGTVFVRVRLLATRTLGAGNSGAAFDAVELRLHNQLAPVFSKTLTFDTPTTQSLATDWQQVQYTAAGIALKLDPNSVITFDGSSLSAVESGWTVAAPTAGKVTGQFDLATSSTTAYRFARAAGAAANVVRASGTAEQNFGAFTAATSFTVWALLRVDEPGFATACGITGRADAVTGWGLQLSSTGALVATLRGAGGTKLIARTGSVLTDGALHLVGMAYDAVGKTLTVIDERGSNVVSTATGLGEFANTTSGVAFRIGHDSTASDSLPGQVARLYVLPGLALPVASVQSLWTYGKDPSGLLTSYTRTVPALVIGKDDADGATLHYSAFDQVALSYTSYLAADGGTGYGLALTAACANLVPSQDLTDATKWVPGVGVTLAGGVVDVTGNARGARITGTAAVGVTATPITVGAATTVQFVFWARAVSGATSLTLNLRNSAGVFKQAVVVPLAGGTKWRAYYAGFTAWDASTATCMVELVSTSGAITYDLTGYAFCNQVIDNLPAVFPVGNLGTIPADLVAACAGTIPERFNQEGEVVVVGVGQVDAPATAANILRVDNTVDSKNRRELSVTAAHAARLAHYDGAAAVVNSDRVTTFATTSMPFTLQGRWSRAEVPDVGTNTFAGVLVPSTGATYGRTAAWTNDRTVNTVMRLGGAATPLNGTYRSFTARSPSVKVA